MLAVATKRVLLLGCGHDRRKRLRNSDEPEEFVDCELTTVDINPGCGADVLFDLNQHPLPFEDESFDEIHAYDVLEHFGGVGDWKSWFTEMDDYHRILKPGGTLNVIVPYGVNLTDPGHTRFFHENHFGFCTKEFYERQREKKTAATDYTWFIQGWWEMAYCDLQGDVLGVQMRKA